MSAEPPNLAGLVVLMRRRPGYGPWSVFPLRWHEKRQVVTTGAAEVHGTKQECRDALGSEQTILAMVEESRGQDELAALEASLTRLVQDRHPLRGRRIPWEGFEDGGIEIVADGPLRCRQVQGSEVGGFEAAMWFLIETLDESAADGGLPADACASWGDTLVQAKPGALKALQQWADEYLEVRAWIAEEDEVPRER